MTKEERHLWYDFLRTYPVRFSRQKVLGKYIADFYSAEAKLVIELDGSQHYEADAIQKDADRTTFLERYGLTVIRISNNEVSRNFRGVCGYIDATVKQSLSQLRPRLRPDLPRRMTGTFRCPPYANRFLRNSSFFR